MAAITINVSTVKPLGDRVFIKVSASEEKPLADYIYPMRLKKNLKWEK